MTDILLGFFGALVVLALLTAGALIGWKAHKSFVRYTAPSAEPIDEQERKRLEAEQDAFRQLQNYSADTAYGMGSNPFDQGGDG